MRRAGGTAGVDAPASGYVAPLNALITGDKLYSACQSWSDKDQGVCLGYIMGIADALSSPNGLLGRSACPSKGVKVGELQDIMMKFLDNHETKRQFAAATVLTEAFAERFPCKE
jgi:Rap1a immunity proteins